MSLLFWLAVLGISIFGIVLIFTGNVQEFFRWIKGSRTSYYMKPSLLDWATTTASLRSSDTRRLAGYNGAIVEVNRGFLRRRSEIFGLDPVCWKIAKSWAVPNPADGYTGDRVALSDTQGLSAELALKVVSRYTSFEELLKDFGKTKTSLRDAQKSNDELQKNNNRLFEQYKEKDIESGGRRVKFENAFAQLTETQAAIKAILLLINSDRQQYRSKAAERIRQCLEFLDYWESGQPFDKDPEIKKIEEWRNRFNRVTYPEKA